MIDITLHKAKYRNPDSRVIHRDDVERLIGAPYGFTRVFNGGRFGAKPRTNSPQKKTGLSLRPRRRAYGPWLGKA